MITRLPFALLLPLSTFCPLASPRDTVRDTDGSAQDFWKWSEMLDLESDGLPEQKLPNMDRKKWWFYHEQMMDTNGYNKWWKLMKYWMINNDKYTPKDGTIVTWNDMDTISSWFWRRSTETMVSILPKWRVIHPQLFPLFREVDVLK